VSKLTHCGTTVRFVSGTALAALLVFSPIAATAATNEHNQNASDSGKVSDTDLIVEEVALVRGETISLLLRRKGVVEADRNAAIKALGDMPDLKTLQKGQKVKLVLRPTGSPYGAARLVSVNFATESDREVTVAAGTEFAHSIDETLTDWTVKLVTRKGVVGSSLEKGLELAGVPKPVEEDVVTASRLSPSLPKKLPTDTAFTVVYKAQFKKVGKTGDKEAGGETRYELTYAGFKIGEKEHLIYRYQMPAGMVAFLTPDGKGKASLALANPLPGAPVTSPHGWRVHPIYRVRKFHRGVDLGAPSGTPIYAPADGVVVERQWRTGYGRRIVISHGDGVKTAYSHLSRYGSAKIGSSIKKGEVVAYVGASGRVTGPHLDYELIRNGKYLNPLRANITQSVALSGEELDLFRTYVAEAGHGTEKVVPVADEPEAPAEEPVESVQLTLDVEDSDS